MRGKVTDQDLTNYALNELPADERLYVESMLGVSEECRGDVYQMLELSEMLKEGFEADEAGAELLLNEEQRTKVLTVPRWNWRGFVRQAAAITLLAAGTALATRPVFWKKGGAGGMGADAGSSISGMLTEFKDLPATLEEFNARLQAIKASDPSEWQFVGTQPAICTPTTLTDMPAMPEVSEM
jgi:hypothetical protein